MEFGIFTNMYHPKHWRDGRCARSTRRSGTSSSTSRSATGWASSTRGRPSTTSSTSTPTCRRPRASWPTPSPGREHIHVGSAIMNITAPGEPPRAHRRARGHARPPERGPVRVRHRSGVVSTEAYGFGIESGTHPRALRRGAAPDRADVGRGRLLLRRRQLLDAHPPGAAQALHRSHPPIWVASWRNTGHASRRRPPCSASGCCASRSAPPTLAPLVGNQDEIEKAEPVVGDYQVNDNRWSPATMLCLETALRYTRPTDLRRQQQQVPHRSRVQVPRLVPPP